MFHVKPFFLLLFLFPLILKAQHVGKTKLEVKEMPVFTISNNNINLYLSQFKEYNSLNNLQKEWFYWTNYSRNNPRGFWDSIVVPILQTFPNLNNSYSASLKKDLYAASPLPLLRPNTKLAATSSLLARELASKNADPSHTSPSGITFQQRMQTANIKTCAGENISFGSWNTPLMLVLLYIDEGVTNLGHRKSLLNPAFTEMGIGLGDYPDNKVMVVQDFACSQQ